MAEPQLLDPHAAARARQLEFFARTRMEGYLKGPNPSRLKGQSSDFLRHRQYQAGDDLRHLDWRVYGRSDRLVIREYEEYTNLEVIIGIDCSGSMGYTNEGMGKLDFAVHAAAMLGFLLNLQKDRFGIARCSSKLEAFLRPSSGRKHLAQAMRYLASTEAAGETDFAACVHQLLPLVRRKSVFVFFSDCYQDPHALAKALGILRLQGHDVLLYQLYAQDEHELGFTGYTLFRDLETGVIDAADPMEIRAAYQQVVREHLEHLQAGCNRFGLEFHSIAVRDEYDDIMARLLRQRNRRA